MHMCIYIYIHMIGWRMLGEDGRFLRDGCPENTVLSTELEDVGIFQAGALCFRKRGVVDDSSLENGSVMCIRTHKISQNSWEHED